MKIAGFLRDHMVLGAFAAVLLGSYAVQSGENLMPVGAPDTNLAAESSMPSVVAGALPEEAPADSAYDELVRLARAGVDQSVMLSYVENSLRFFELDADRIIYLTDLGMPSEIIEAAIERDQQLLQEGISPIPEESAEPKEAMKNSPAEVTEDDLYEILAPYGSWFYIEGYGRCWRPTVVIYHTGWRPYCDNGRWVYTDCGWYWMSDYSWGWAAFHYGRWFRHDRYGWCWWPDTVWAPSWVSWRYDRTYCGWAPLPPYTSYRSGTGIIYRGSRVSVGFNFGLDSDCYTFIATKYFCDPKPSRYVVDSQEAKRIYDRTRVFNRIDYDARKKSVVNGGISPNIISALSRQTVEPVTVRHEQSRSQSIGRHEQLNRKTQTLVVRRPQYAAPQNKPSAARTDSITQRTPASRQRNSYGAAAAGSHRVSGHAAVRRPDSRVQRTTPSGTRPPSSASQARPPQTTAPSVVSATPQPAARPPASPQQSSRQYSSQNNRSNGNAYGRGQVNRPSSPGRSNAANGKE